MKAISLWQPHVLAIALGLKVWETRDWSLSYRGPMAFQAAKRKWTDYGEWHNAAARKLAHALNPVARMERLDNAYPAVCEALVYGAVICVADVVECVRTRELRGRIPAEHEFWGDFSDGETGKGRYAWRLENVRVLPKPLPWRGEQGLFDVDDAALGCMAKVSEATPSLFGEMA
jgi:hypothetical protein